MRAVIGYAASCSGGNSSLPPPATSGAITASTATDRYADGASSEMSNRFSDGASSPATIAAEAQQRQGRCQQQEPAPSPTRPHHPPAQGDQRPELRVAHDSSDR